MDLSCATTSRFAQRSPLRRGIEWVRFVWKSSVRLPTCKTSRPDTRQRDRRRFDWVALRRLDSFTQAQPLSFKLLLLALSSIRVIWAERDSCSSTSSRSFRLDLAWLRRSCRGLPNNHLTFPFGRRSHTSQSFSPGISSSPNRVSTSQALSQQPRTESLTWVTRLQHRHPLLGQSDRGRMFTFPTEIDEKGGFSAITRVEYDQI